MSLQAMHGTHAPGQFCSVYDYVISDALKSEGMLMGCSQI